MGAIRAAFAASCPGCPLMITPGDRVVYVDDHPVHEGCEESALTLLALKGRPIGGGFDHDPDGSAA